MATPKRRTELRVTLSDGKPPKPPGPPAVSRAEVLQRFWRGRDDHHAVQKPDGGYLGNIAAPITLEMLERHLRGEITVGQYQLTADGKVWWLCLDLDDEAVSEDELARAEALFTLLRLAYVVEESSPGRYHLWLFLDEAMPAGEAHHMGAHVKAAISLPANREWFPKQGSIGGGKGLGNLVRLPLGLHQAKGTWSQIRDFTTEFPVNRLSRVRMAYQRLKIDYPEAAVERRIPRPDINVSDQKSPRVGGSFRERKEALYAAIGTNLPVVMAHVFAAHGVNVPPNWRAGEKAKCAWHSAGDNGSTGRPSMMVGRDAFGVRCFSDNCRLANVWLSPLDVVRELRGSADLMAALEYLEVLVFGETRGK